MLMQNKWRLVSGSVRTFMGTPKKCATHYDVLGITPRATQGDIKTAYYKLSKVYHPDKSNDEGDAKKFRAVAEAYEVLGNVKLKKMYDRGLLQSTESTTRGHYQPEPEPVDPTLKFYKSRSRRQMTPTMDGAKPVYDFDSWSKIHYGNLFHKEQYNKEMLKKKQQKYEETIKANNQEALLYLIFIVSGLFIVCVVHGVTDYDLDRAMANKRAQAQSQEITNKNTDQSNSSTQ